MIVGPPSTICDVPRETLYAARRYTRRLALSHYENFTVISFTLPRPLRQHFSNIYAFCRNADDLADEITDTAESLAKLAALRNGLLSLYGQSASAPSILPEPTLQNGASSPITQTLIALSDTIRTFNIPPQPFLNLISAFEQDRRKSRYATYDELADYCRRSADPVGHLVLYLSGYRDVERQRLADFTCTSLQLVNFWQDVVPDLSRGRIYFPAEDLQKFDVSEKDIIERRPTAGFIEMMRFQVNRCQELFDSGQALIPMLDRRLRRDISLFAAGGRAILDSIRAQGYDTLSSRPSLGKGRKLALFARALLHF